MKTNNIFSLAALALMMTACGNEDNIQNPSGARGVTVPFTATISAGNSVTRSLTEDAEKNIITAAWEKDEVVALVHGKTVDVLGVESVDETSGTATINGTINNAVNGEDVMVVYLGKTNMHMSDFVSAINMKLSEDESLTEITEEMVTSTMGKILSQLHQAGTLMEISMHADQRFGKGKLAVSTESSTIDKTVTVSEQNAIWKLSLTDGTNKINATQLTINEETYVTPSEATNVFYVALQPASEKDFTIKAVTNDSKNYTYTTKATLKAGKFYRSELKMSEAQNPDPVSYRVGSWNGSEVIFTGEQTSDYTIVESSEVDVTWSKGTYVVNSAVKIEGNITLTGDVDLILCDAPSSSEGPGGSLRINGKINGDYTLNIYGQSAFSAKSSPRLVIDSQTLTEENVSLQVKNLNIHGGNIAVRNNSLKAIGATEINIYDGSLVPECTGTDGIGILATGVFNVYGGDQVNVRASGNAVGIAGGADGVNIYGGNVTAMASTKSDGYGGTGIRGHITINGGYVIAGGGDSDDSGKAGGYAIECGILRVNDGTLWASGGQNGSAEQYANAISGNIIVAEGLTYYENSSESFPTETGTPGNSSNSITCTKRCVKIEPTPTTE